jgi:tetratricopeptide (TPR) repeat protein
MLLVLALVLGGSAGCTKQMRKARLVSKGDKGFAAERYDWAEIEYLGALRFPPPDPHAVARLGIICYNQGRWANAVVYLNEAVKLQPTNAEARVKLGLAQLLFQQFKAAQEQALAVLAKEPENPNALMLLAGSMTSTQDLAQAEQAFAKVSPKGQTQPGYHLARGTLYLHQRDFTRAETEYRQELAVDPKSDQAYLALGNLFLRRQDLKQAEPALKQAAELAPLRSGARLTYASLRLQTGNAEAAVKEIQDLVKKAPDYLPAWIFLAHTAAAQGKPEESAACLERVLARDPVNLEGLSLNGSLLVAKGDAPNAATMFERILKTYSPGTAQVHYNLAQACLMKKDTAGAVASLNRALALQTNYADAILLLASLNVRQGNSTAAIAWLTRLVQQQPQLARAHLDLATAYLGRKNLDEAAGVYRRMMQVFTNSAEVPFHLGSVLMVQNKANEARQAFERSLAVAPDFLPAIEQLVDLDLRQNRAAEATERVAQLIKKYPTAAALQMLLASIHLTQAGAVVAKANEKNTTGPELRLGDVPAARENINQAEAALLKAIEMSPDYRPTYQSLASLYISSNRAQEAIDRLNALLSRTNDTVCLLERGVIEEQMKDYSAARDTYEKVLKAQPNAIGALNNLALLYAEHLGQLDKGCQLAEKARQLQPNNAYIADTLGWILYRRGDYVRALNLLWKAVEKLPATAEFQYHLGMTHYMLGEEEPARVALQRAMAGKRDYAWKPEATRCLALLALDVKGADAGTVAELEQRLREAPNDIPALVRLAPLQEREGALDKAIRTYETALHGNPQNPQLLAKLARLYDQSPDTSQKALDFAREAHAQAPDDARISHLLGRLAYKSGQYNWACSLLEESARKLPNGPALLYDLAWSQYSVGKVPEALASMQAASQAALPADRASEAKRFLELVAAAKDPAEADPAGRAVTETRAILATNAVYVPALMVSAAVQEKQAEFSAAARSYETVLQRYPLLAPAIRALALVAFDHLGDDQKAYPLAVKAREFFPVDADVARMLGVLAYRRGNYSRAAQLLAESARQKTGDAEVLYYLGMAHYQLKERAQSKQLLQRALALNLPVKLTEEANRVLKELK